MFFIEKVATETFPSLFPSLEAVKNSFYVRVESFKKNLEYYSSDTCLRMARRIKYFVDFNCVIYQVVCDPTTCVKNFFEKRLKYISFKTIVENASSPLIKGLIKNMVKIFFAKQDFLPEMVKRRLLKKISSKLEQHPVWTPAMHERIYWLARSIFTKENVEKGASIAFDELSTCFDTLIAFESVLPCLQIMQNQHAFAEQNRLQAKNLRQELVYLLGYSGPADDYQENMKNKIAQNLCQFLKKASIFSMLGELEKNIMHLLVSLPLKPLIRDAIGSILETLQESLAQADASQDIAGTFFSWISFEIPKEYAALIKIKGSVYTDILLLCLLERVSSKLCRLESYTPRVDKNYQKLLKTTKDVFLHLAEFFKKNTATHSLTLAGLYLACDCLQAPPDHFLGIAQKLQPSRLAAPFAASLQQVIGRGRYGE